MWALGLAARASQNPDDRANKVQLPAPSVRLRASITIFMSSGNLFDGVCHYLLVHVSLVTSLHRSYHFVHLPVSNMVYNRVQWLTTVVEHVVCKTYCCMHYVLH